MSAQPSEKINETGNFIRTVEKMLRDGRDWPYIGRAFGMSGQDARTNYERHQKS